MAPIGDINMGGEEVGGSGLRVVKGVMPMRRMTGLPEFKGKELADWLEQYETTADTYGVGGEGKVKGLIWYLSREEPLNIYDWAKQLDSFQARDWEGVKEDLLESFPEEEKERYAVSDLRALRREQSRTEITSVADLADYKVRFERIAKWLAKENMVSESELADEFFGGFTSSIREVLLVEARVRAGEKKKEENFTYHSIFLRVKAILGADDPYAVSARRLGKGVGSEEAVGGRQEEKGELTTKSKASTTIPAIPTPTTSASKPDPMEVITRQLQQLQIAFANMNSQPTQPRPQSAAYPIQHDTPPHFNATTPTGNLPVPYPPRPGFNPPQFPCVVCKGPAPYHWKSQCPHLKEFLDKGIVRVDMSTRRVIFSDGTEVPALPEGMLGAIRERESQQRNSRPATLLVPSVSNGPRSFVSAAVDYDAYPAEKRGRDQEDEGGRERGKRREVGEPYVEIPVRRPGPRLVPAINNPANPTSESRVRFEPEDEVMEEGEIGRGEDEGNQGSKDGGRKGKENGVGGEEKVKRMPASQRWSNVKSRYNEEASHIPSAILDSKLSLSVGSVLSLNNDLAKTMSEEFRIRRVPIPTTTWKAKGNSATLEEEETERVGRTFMAAAARGPLYAGVTGRVTLDIGGIRVSAIFDTGSEVNLMPQRIFAKTRLGITHGQHYLGDANNGSTRLLGYCENVPITCGSITVNQHVYVQKEAAYEFLVGMPFLRSTGARTWFDEQGSLWVRLHGKDGERVSVCMTVPEDPRNVTSINPPSQHLDDDEEGGTYENSRATLLTGDEVAEEADDELEWPIRWEEFRKMDWATEVEKDLRNREKPIIMDGQRVQCALGELEVGEEENVRDVYLAELEEGGNWDLAMTMKEQRGWIADLKREERRMEDEEKERKEVSKKEEEEKERKEVSEEEEEEEEGGETYTYEVHTKYKKKGVKVQPVDTQLPDHFRTSMLLPPMSRDPYKTPLTPYPPEFEYGGRLTEERVGKIDFGPEGFIGEEEKKLLLGVLRLRENALAFDEMEMGRRKETYGAPTIIPSVPHQPWQQSSFPVPNALRKQVISLFRRQVEAGVLEPSQAGYASRWFALEKKNKDVRWIFDSQKLNSVTIRDAGLPPNVRDYVDEMVGHHSYFLIDLFSGYLQEPLDVSSRDLTTIRTPIGLLRLTRLPIGFTNSVAVFQRRISFILFQEIPEVCVAFIDDIGGKGSKDDYGGEVLKENGKIRKWVWEHAVRFERILFRLEEAGLTASGKKLVVITPKLQVLGSVVSKEGKSAEEKKVKKVEEWPAPKNLTELRGWYGLVNYLRDFIEGEEEAEAVIRKKLVGKGMEEWEWTEEDQSAMDSIKKALGKGIVLRTLDYDEGAGEIMLAVDSSSVAVGIALWQVGKEDGQRYPIRFDSIPFNDVQSRYSRPKLELAGAFIAIKKFQAYLYGTHFILEIDATALQQMINTPELPNAAMTRWVGFIKNFDFSIRHIAGKDHIVPDALSRRRKMEEEGDEEIEVEEEEFWAMPGILRGGGEHASTLSRDEEEREGEGEEDDNESAITSTTPGTIAPIDELTLAHFPPEWKILVMYLQTGTRPEGTTLKEWRDVQQRGLGFRVRDGRLWKRERGVELEVVFDKRLREEILLSAHEQTGHRGRDATYRRISDRFWWPKLYVTVRQHLQSCEGCQFRRKAREKEELTPTSVSRIFQKVGCDLVHMGEGSGQYKYLMVARDDFSGWVEARGLRKKGANEVAKFLWEDVISRMGVIGWIVSDNGTEMKAAVDLLLDRYSIPHITTTSYHPEANAMVERGHGPLVESVIKASREAPTKWHQHLHAALWADRITTKRTTGYSPFEMIYGATPLLPIDLQMETWLAVEWKQEMTREELVAARTRQLERREEDMESARKKMEEARRKSTTYMDHRYAHQLRLPLPLGSLVLQHDTSLDKQWSRKVADRWYGPFKVVSQLPGKSYFLSELDGTHLKKPVSANRLKRFYPRGAVLEDEGVGAEVGEDSDDE